MRPMIFVRLASALALTAGLAACVDATYQIDVTSETTASATMTQIMARSIYDMIMANKDVKAPASLDRNFCADGKLTVDAETATCVIVKQGSFSALTPADAPGKEPVRFSPYGQGLVKVVFPTAEMGSQLNAAPPDDDPDTRIMMKQMFDSHTVTLKVTGASIEATNMVLAPDKKSASTQIPLSDLLNGTITLPSELFAIVKPGQ